MKTKNYVYLSGSIVYIHYSENVCSIILASEATKIPTFVSVVSFSNKEISNLKIRDRIIIEGHIQLQVKRDEFGNVNKRQQTYIADKIEKIPRILSKGRFCKDENKAYIFGKISHIYRPKENVCILTIRVPYITKREKKMHNSCQVVCLKKQADYTMNLQEGDYVITSGYITSKTEINSDGTKKTKNSIVCNDIEKVDEFEDME